MEKTQWYDITLPLNEEIPLMPPVPPQPVEPSKASLLTAFPITPISYNKCVHAGQIYRY